MPLAKDKTRFTYLDMAVFGLFVCGCAWLAYRINVKIHYKWNWAIIPQYLYRFDPVTDKWVPGLIIQGLLTTIRLSVWATALGLLFGTVMGVLRCSPRLFRRLLGWGYVELIRNIPIIVWIFIFYYFVSDQITPLLGIDKLAASNSEPVRVFVTFWAGSPNRFPAFVSGLLALAIYEGAYITEIVRAGIQSIEKGQWEAAAALGFSRWQQLRHIVFPQALKRVLPPLAGQFISTIKDSSIVSVISIQELTFQGMELMAASFRTFEVWITILGLYLLLCLACSLATERLEIYLQKAPS
ncbi:amino acid ABC transporter permease [Thermodesulfobacteriota bacterium]